MDQKRLFALLPAFFALTYVLHGQVFSPLKSEPKRLLSAQTATQQQPLEAALREPASFAPSDTSVLEVDCSKQDSIEHQLSKRYVRIIGKGCSTDTKISADTFGYSPEMFWTKKGQFSTELIHLKKGANAIRILQGSEQRNIIVSRQ